MTIRYIGGLVLVSDDPAGLAEWYREALALPFVRQEHDTWYTMLRTHEGAVHLGISPRSLVPDASHGSSVLVTLRVDDLDAAVKRLRDHDVPVQRQQTEDGPFAFFTDPDGNRLALWGC